MSPVILTNGWFLLSCTRQKMTGNKGIHQTTPLITVQSDLPQQFRDRITCGIYDWCCHRGFRYKSRPPPVVARGHQEQTQMNSIGAERAVNSRGHEREAIVC